MKFFGEPNHLVTKEGKPFFAFDENGEFDLDVWGEKYKEKIAYELKKHFRCEDIMGAAKEKLKEEEEEEEEEDKPKTKCKVCNEEFTNLGEFLAHSKTHKKKG